MWVTFAGVVYQKKVRCCTKVIQVAVGSAPSEATGAFPSDTAYLQGYGITFANVELDLTLFTLDFGQKELSVRD